MDKLDYDWFGDLRIIQAKLLVRTDNPADFHDVHCMGESGWAKIAQPASTVLPES